MLARHRVRRPGVTLTEVLVALFVMALGMVALLTLFPLGAMQVGQALKDDRCAQAALQGDAYVRQHWRHEVVPKLAWADRGQVDPLVWAFDDPNATAPPANDPASPGGTPRPATPSGPVLIDPIWYHAFLPTDVPRSKVASSTTLPRRSLSTVTSQAPNESKAAFRICAMTDDLTFQPNGSAGNATTPPQRQGFYTWAALVQRPRADTLGVATLSILTYYRRPSSVGIAGDEWSNTFSPTGGGRSVTLNAVPARGPNDSPLLTRGGWVLLGNATSKEYKFHRVVGLAEGATTGNVTVDIDPPTALTAAGTYHLFAGLAEVMERPALRPDPDEQP